jgi:hypothetical protein
MQFCKHGDYSEGQCPECNAILEEMMAADEIEIEIDDPRIIDMLEKKAQEDPRNPLTWEE